jgi:hypothetical protein
MMIVPISAPQSWNGDITEAGDDRRAGSGRGDVPARDGGPR